ncbi:MAG: hypothetical protein KF802_12025 [Bdellovibrionaceae bacterium]|nr:hypothetical protein [Pseudobdellovibrionaceae bacterium]
MEKFKVLGEELRGHYQPGALLQDVFSDIEEELRREELVVCQYIVNGMALAEKEEARFASLPLSEIESLEYVAEKSQTLLNDVVNGWLLALPELMKGAETLSERLRGGQVKGLIKAVYDLAENCEFLISSLASVRQLIGDEKAVAALEGFDRLEIMTRRSLEEAVRRLEAQDLFHLSEVLEYDLNHCLEEWRRVLLQFREMGAGGGGNASNTHSVGRGNSPH